jgi:hypothetical protein
MSPPFQGNETKLYGDESRPSLASQSLAQFAINLCQPPLAGRYFDFFSFGFFIIIIFFTIFFFKKKKRRRKTKWQIRLHVPRHGVLPMPRACSLTVTEATKPDGTVNRLNSK